MRRLGSWTTGIRHVNWLLYIVEWMISEHLSQQKALPFKSLWVCGQDGKLEDAYAYVIRYKQVWCGCITPSSRYIIGYVGNDGWNRVPTGRLIQLILTS